MFKAMYIKIVDILTSCKCFYIYDINLSIRRKSMTLLLMIHIVRHNVGTYFSKVHV